MSLQGMPGGWLHPRHHRSCLRHQLHRRNQSCMARPHIADRWSLGVAHDGSWSRNPWSGSNWSILGRWSFWSYWSYFTKQNHIKWAEESEDLQWQAKKKSIVYNVYIASILPMLTFIGFAGLARLGKNIIRGRKFYWGYRYWVKVLMKGFLSLHGRGEIEPRPLGLGALRHTLEAATMAMLPSSCVAWIQVRKEHGNFDRVHHETIALRRSPAGDMDFWHGSDPPLQILLYQWS